MQYVRVCVGNVIFKSLGLLKVKKKGKYIRIILNK